MPKHRKKHTARAQQRAEDKKAAEKRSKRGKASQTRKLKPKTKEKKKVCAGSFRGTIPAESGPPTLGSRFAGLPAEVRAEIFSWLLVRPVKWSATHTDHCPLRHPNATNTPFQDIRPWMGFNRETCVTAHASAARWRQRSIPIFTDPWRSVWAPPVTNEFLCSLCWDDRFRSHPAPRIDSLPCLCARERRTDGLAALLVCKAWYEEGGRVLYTRNTFAFATPKECAAFFGALSPRWSAVVSKVSLLALAPVPDFPRPAGEELDNIVPDSRGLREAWTLLRKLPALSELELDAFFLTDRDCVRIFRGPSLRNLRKINFTQAMPMKPADAPRDLVWPRRALRRVIEATDFTVDVAKGIKGWRYGWVRGQDRGDRQAIVNERIRYRTRFKTQSTERIEE